MTTQMKLAISILGFALFGAVVIVMVSQLFAPVLAPYTVPVLVLAVVGSTAFCVSALVWRKRFKEELGS